MINSPIMEPITCFPKSFSKSEFLHEMIMVLSILDLFPRGGNNFKEGWRDGWEEGEKQEEEDGENRREKIGEQREERGGGREGKEGEGRRKIKGEEKKAEGG